MEELWKQENEWRTARNQKSGTSAARSVLSRTLVSDVAGAARNGLYEGGDYFDNLGSSNYNNAMLLGKELEFAKPHTQFLDYCPYRSRQINPR